MHGGYPGCNKGHFTSVEKTNCDQVFSLAEEVMNQGASNEASRSCDKGSLYANSKRLKGTPAKGRWRC